VQRGSISSRLIVGAVLVLALAAVADALKPGSGSPSLSSPPERVSSPGIQHPGGKPAIERIGAEWARRFASNDLSTCYHTGQELCERLHCIHAGGYKVANCRLPTRAYRRSFRDAAVDDVFIEQHEAVARLSNGQVIRLEADRGAWWVLAVGRDVARGFYEKPG